MAWKYDISPCSKQAIHLLEKNTKIVTWLKLKHGDIKDQIPCIMYKNKYFSLSLRMQKAIYRHVRLKKGFQNEETIDGMKKLKIPDVLLKEKMRTQSRFDVNCSLSLPPYLPLSFFISYMRFFILYMFECIIIVCILIFFCVMIYQAMQYICHVYTMFYFFIKLYIML